MKVTLHRSILLACLLGLALSWPADAQKREVPRGHHPGDVLGHLPVRLGRLREAAPPGRADGVQTDVPRDHRGRQDRGDGEALLQRRERGSLRLSGRRGPLRFMANLAKNSAQFTGRLSPPPAPSGAARTGSWA